jgi:TPP-dependent 2-oxoacid decarboxylase
MQLTVQEVGSMIREGLDILMWVSLINLWLIHELWLMDIASS